MSSEYVMAPRPDYTLPSSGTKFSKRDVEMIIRDVCTEFIGPDRPYVFEEVQPLIKDMGNEIQQRIVRLGYERYKLVTHCVVTEAASQGIRVTSRCLWDPETDNYAAYTFSNESMHVSVVVFGVYWE